MERDIRPRSARDIMSRYVLTVRADDALVDAVHRILRHGYSGAPVVDADGELVGILSEVDCSRTLAEASYFEAPEGSVAERMSTDVLTVEPATDILRVLQLLDQRGVRRLPVVDRDRVVGLVTRRDVLRGLSDMSRERQKARAQPVYEGRAPLVR